MKLCASLGPLIVWDWQ